MPGMHQLSHRHLTIHAEVGPVVVHTVGATMASWVLLMSTSAAIAMDFCESEASQGSTRPYLKSESQTENRKERTRAREVAQRLRALACSFKGPRFNSKHPHGGSQLSVTPVPGHLMSSLTSECIYCTHMMHRYKCWGTFIP